MSVARPFNELEDQTRAELGEGEYERLRAEARLESDAQIAAFEQSLAELRRAHAFTQTRLAQVLDVTQTQVSRIERQTDMYLSTLISYVEAMGGELELVAKFPGQPPVTLAIGDLTSEPEADQSTEHPEAAAS